MKIEIIKPYGYCAGVNRVINLLKKVKEEAPLEPIYCMGEVVHNEIVNSEIAKNGVNILHGNQYDNLNKIEKGIIIFPAHGTSDELINLATSKKDCKVINAVCPFVEKEFEIIKKIINNNEEIIYIGKKGHAESLAALSISTKIIFISEINDIRNLKIDNNKTYNVINQTTLSTLDLKEIYELLEKKIKNLKIIDEICNATRTRQEKVKEIDSSIDGVIVVGDIKSNNTISLFEIAKKICKNAILIDKFSESLFSWVEGKENIRIVSGASTPNFIVEEIEKKLKK